MPLTRHNWNGYAVLHIISMCHNKESITFCFRNEYWLCKIFSGCWKKHINLSYIKPRSSSRPKQDYFLWRRLLSSAFTVECNYQKDFVLVSDELSPKICVFTAFITFLSIQTYVRVIVISDLWWQPLLRKSFCVL